MTTIPRDGKLDSSLSLLREGNHFIPRRCQRLRSDIFQTRLLFEPTLCLHGEAAARLFYDQSRFTREGAAPGMLKKTRSAPKVGSSRWGLMVAALIGPAMNSQKGSKFL